MSSSYFTKISVTRNNKYQRNIYFIGLGYDRVTKVNPSSQFQFKKPRKCGEIKIFLIEKGHKMKSILRINTLLTNSNVKEKEFINGIIFLKMFY